MGERDVHQQHQRLPPGRGNRNAMCDDRGRVQGLLDLYCIREDHFLVVLEGVDAEWFQERYRMFLMLDDIEVDELAGEATLLSVQGPAAASVLASAGLPTQRSNAPMRSMRRPGSVWPP